VALFSALCVGGSAAPQGARARTVVSAPAAAELVGLAPESQQVRRGGAVVAVGSDFHVVADGTAVAAEATGLQRLKGYLSEARMEEMLSNKKTVAMAASAVSAAGLLYVLASTGKDDTSKKQTPAAKAQKPAAEKEEEDSAAMLLKMKKEELQAARSSGRRESTTLGTRPDPSITGTGTASRGGAAAGDQGAGSTFVDAEGKPVVTKVIGARPLGYQTTTLSK